MKVGQRVLIYTASSTFRGTEGHVIELVRGGARVQIANDPYAPMFFKQTELVPASEPHIGGAE